MNKLREETARLSRESRNSASRGEEKEGDSDRNHATNGRLKKQASFIRSVDLIARKILPT
jgi:hypothetical protein